MALIKDTLKDIDIGMAICLTWFVSLSDVQVCAVLISVTMSGAGFTGQAFIVRRLPW